MSADPNRQAPPQSFEQMQPARFLHTARVSRAANKAAQKNAVDMHVHMYTNIWNLPIRTLFIRSLVQFEQIVLNELPFSFRLTKKCSNQVEPRHNIDAMHHFTAVGDRVTCPVCIVDTMHISAAETCQNKRLDATHVMDEMSGEDEAFGNAPPVT